MPTDVRPVLGTMTLGDTVDFQDSMTILRRFVAAGFREIDTAHIYSDGASEEILGRALAHTGLTNCSLATKVHPRVSGKLDEASVADQVEESLRRLKRSAIDLLYLHFPDPTTDLERTLWACNQLHRRGLIQELGMSNFGVDDVVAAQRICRGHGWLAPSVYQGLYNGLGRRVEDELVPTLRRCGMRFYAYNPLAGGLLSGKYREFDDGPGSGRLATRPSYHRRYWKRSLVEAVGILQASADTVGISLSNASLRWMAFHSALDGSMGDAIVVGVSRPDHLAQNLAALQAGPLPDIMVEAFEAAWVTARAESPSFVRQAEAQSMTPGSRSDASAPSNRTCRDSGQ